MRVIIQLVAGFCLVFSGNNVLAVDRLEGEPASTGFSGYGGAELTLSKPVSENDAIFGVEMAERNDDPCFLRLRYRDVTTGEERSSKYFAECDDNNSDRGRDASRISATLPADMVVTGASICLNTQRDKLKGLELRAKFRECVRGENTANVSLEQCASVFRQGSMEYRLCMTGHPRYNALSCSSSRSTINRYFERPACRGTNRGPDSDWEQIIECPEGSVATGFKVSTRSSDGERVLIDGLALECARVATKKGEPELSTGVTGSKVSWSD